MYALCVSRPQKFAIFETQSERACKMCAVIIACVDAMDVLDLLVRMGALGSAGRHGVQNTGGHILSQTTRRVSDSPKWRHSTRQ